MKTPSREVRWLLGAALAVVGVLSFFMSLMLTFGWLVSETQPSFGHKLLTGCFGLLVLAASVACFILARRQIRLARVA
jgi:hypothetical protein